MIRDASFLLLLLAIVLMGRTHSLPAMLAIAFLMLTGIARSAGSAALADTFATVTFVLLAIATGRALVATSLAPRTAASNADTEPPTLTRPTNDGGATER